jgi:periplasmic divalent cation tolerance protein
MAKARPMNEHIVAPDDAIVVITTTENQSDAEHLAQKLVEQELAACVQIIPQIHSVYRWQSKIETASETLLLIKTTHANFDALVASFKTLHSYQTPEIMALPATNVSDDYLAWLRNSVKTFPPAPNL